MKKIVLATSNPNKLREINAITSLYGITLVAAPEGFDPVENGKTFEENATIKAREAAKLTGSYALADDTGLCVEALNGRPGIYSARYAKTQDEKIKKMLDELKNIPFENRKAYFICTMVLVDEKGKILHLSTGRIDGFINNEPRGAQGFGYDPIFFIPSLNKTMAELTEDEKNTISHRALALIDMIKFFQTL